MKDVTGILIAAIGARQFGGSFGPQALRSRWICYAHVSQPDTEGSL
jgi:hypothetical protein